MDCTQPSPKLEDAQVFDGLTERDLREIAEIGKTLELKREQIVFAPEDEADHVYVLASGKVKLAKVADDGKEVTIAVLQPGDVFGELSLFSGETHDTFAEVIEDATIYAIPRADFEGLLSSRPALSLALLSSIMERLRQAESQIEDLVFRSVPARVAHLILKLAQDHGHVGPKGITVRLRLTHQDVANFVGATRETVTNVLNDLRADGLIEIEHKQIRILDYEGLQAAASVDRG